MTKFKLFGIDLQNSFGKEGNPLCVPGATEDMKRIAKLIDDNIQNIDDIILTIDTHPVDHIGHPGWWKMKDGSEPAPFTFVTPEMIENGDIGPVDENQLAYATRYVTKLGGSMIWPVHCVPGTESYELVKGVKFAVNKWWTESQRIPTIIKKGYQRNTESFGIFEAEYDDGSYGAEFNAHLMDSLYNEDLPIVIVGEASSHCVKRSVEQLLTFLEDHNVVNTNMILLSDCTSPVPGFEMIAEKFIQDIKSRGVMVCTSSELKGVLEAW